MNKMKLVGPYNGYAKPEMWDNSSEVTCYVDNRIRLIDKKSDKQVILLIEPRPIQEDVYHDVLKKASLVRYVFTHDSQLLAVLPNAKPIIWGGCWVKCEFPEKTRFMSCLCSHKYLTDLHKVRYDTCQMFKNYENFDLFGPFDDNHRIDPSESYIPYKYTLAIENYIDDIWITEKVIGCFATKTIPIYLGANNIGDYFNTEGMIIVKDKDDLQKTVKSMLENQEYWEDYYNDVNVQKAINENYEKSKQYWYFEDWFYTTYEKEIGGLFEG